MKISIMLEWSKFLDYFEFLSNYFAAEKSI